MGVTIQQYRTAVGLYYARSYTYHGSNRVPLTDILDNLMPGTLLKELLFQCKYISIVLWLLFVNVHTGNVITTLYIYALLITWGNNVESNPGPSSQSDDNTILSIFHINIRSLRNKISYLSDIASEYDIICVSETHLDDNINTSDITIDGYYPTPFRKDRNAHGGGLLVYISEKLLVKRQEHLEFNTESFGSRSFFLDNLFSFVVCTDHLTSQAPFGIISIIQLKQLQPKIILWLLSVT